MKTVKMRHTFGKFALAGLLLLVVGCTKDQNLAPLSNEVTVPLTLTLPSPTTLSSYGVDDDRENEVSRLDIFFFNKDGNVINNVGRQTIRSFGQSGRTITASLAIDRSIAQQQLYVIANGTDALFDGITTKSQLDALEFGSTRMPRQLFLMSAADILRPVADFATGVTMSLTRAVARLDIKLAAKVTNFKIKSVKLVNARSHSYAYQKLDAGNKVTSPAGATMLDYDRVDMTMAEENGFVSRLYSYENYNSDKTEIAKTTSIILGGLYGGSDVTTYYLIDVKDKDDALQIIRNNCYDITITQVDGPGTTEEDDAKTGASANLRYSIEMWKQSDVNTEFDGTLFLSVSERQLQLPRDAFGGSIIVKTNSSGYTVSSPVDENDRPATWLTVKSDGDAVNYSSPVNSSGATRTAFFYVKASSKLKIKVKATQVYGESSIIKLSTTSVAVPALGTGAAPATTLITHGRSNITWTIDPTITKFGDTGDWVRFVLGQQMTGTGTNSQSDQWEIKVVADAMLSTTPSRSAIVKVEAKDNVSGIVEYYKFTVVQLNSTVPTLMPERLYLAAMGNGQTIALPIKSNWEWIAKLYEGNRHAAKITSETFHFVADINGTALPATGDKIWHSYKTSGDDVLYIRFNYNVQGTNKIYDGYVDLASTDGSVTHRVRLHHGDYLSVEVNGITMLDRNLGATTKGPVNRTTASTTVEAGNASGYRYQWGRVPDGYETILSHSGVAQSEAAFANGATSILPSSVPSYNPTAPNSYYQWGRLIRGNNSWLSVTGDTPAGQSEPMRFWDATANTNANASNIENTNATATRTAFDPCPDGWRVPTAKELRQMFLSTSADQPNYKPISGFVANQYGRWIMESKVDSPNDIFFPAGGAVISPTPTTFYAPLESETNITSQASFSAEGYYASSSPAGSKDRFHYLFFNKDKVEMRNDRHPATRASFVAGAMNVRCVKAN